MDFVFGNQKKLAKIVQNEKNYTIAVIKTDHGREFQNESFEKFCEKHGIQDSFLLQELNSKMGLWRGKTDPWKRLLEPY